jgi:hypothetical protein
MLLTVFGTATCASRIDSLTALFSPHPRKTPSRPPSYFVCSYVMDEIDAALDFKNVSIVAN